ncbi:MAG TPA: methyltransferase domain-containing protein [Chitinophagaceae bacterium]|nr:methyltransferase domain-containing protein [Chitinophagaceae bacterium]
MDFLNKTFWDNRWKNNNTGWDMKGSIAPIIKEYFEKQITVKEASILIPGCGNAYEAALLANMGFTDITIVDIAPTLVKNLKEKFKEEASINIIESDFFDLKEKQYDLIFEQTFFCALDPKLRQKYAEKMYRLLKDKGILVGLLFDKVFSFDGPPFGGNRKEYETYFKEYFDFITWKKSNASILPRQGTELFIELRKK